MQVDLFMNGVLLSEAVDGLPQRAIMAFVKRVMLDLLEPNKIDDHVCSPSCKDYHEIVIGGIDDYPVFELCIPR